MARVVGNARQLLNVYHVVDRVADTSCSVLVTGESGTGKELVARGLHAASHRASRPFIAVHCGAHPEAALESELLGHVKGAFTGARTTKLGKLAQANGGTVFLDEIAELSLALQVKLLRVLQLHEYSPVGDTRKLRADVRIVAATAADLEAAVASGTFREDLYYRLNVIHLHVPALRDRREDIPVLAEHFLKTAGDRVGRPQAATIPSRRRTSLGCRSRRARTSSCNDEGMGTGPTGRPRPSASKRANSRANIGFPPDASWTRASTGRGIRAPSRVRTS